MTTDSEIACIAKYASERDIARANEIANHIEGLAQRASVLAVRNAALVVRIAASLAQETGRG